MIGDNDNVVVVSEAVGDKALTNKRKRSASLLEKMRKMIPIVISDPFTIVISDPFRNSAFNPAFRSSQKTNKQKDGTY